MIPPSQPPTLRDLWQQRVWPYFFKKAIVSAILMSGFFYAYFWVLRNPIRPVTTIPMTWIDEWIGFHPWALIPYVSLWIYICLPSALTGSRRTLLVQAGGAVALGLAGLAIFIAWPTTTPPSGIDWSIHPSIQFLKEVDASGNACPSLHVAFAVFTAMWGARILSGLGAAWIFHALNIFWAGMILYSVIATRQHVFIDLACGAVLGALVARINFLWLPRHDPCSG